MAGTTAPAIKTALTALLTARLPDVQVLYGWSGQVERDAVWCDKVSATSEIAGMRAGTKPRNEEYLIDLVCAAGAPGQTAEGVELRVTEISRQVEEVIAEDPKLGLGNTLLSAQLESWELDSAPTPEGHVALLTMRVRFKARLL